MARLVVLNGAPAVGKSTLARRYVDDHPLSLALDLDTLRAMLGRWDEHQERSGELTRASALQLARAHLSAGHDVVVPQLLARAPFLEALERLAAEVGSAFHEVALLATKEDAVERFRARSRERALTGQPDPHLDLVARGGGDRVLHAHHDELMALLATRPHVIRIDARRGEVAETYAELMRRLGPRPTRATDHAPAPPPGGAPDRPSPVGARRPGSTGWTVDGTDDPAHALALALDVLAADPVRSNVVLTLLHARVSHPAAGRYWVVAGRDGPVGVVFQSPLDFHATLTPMEGDAVVVVVDAIAGGGVRLPGVNGEAATAARFAGHWTERSGTAAVPQQGQRIYEVREVRPPAPVGGALRPAALAERDLVVEWLRGFRADTGEAGGDPAPTVDVRLPAGHFWVWDDDGPVSLAALAPPVHGVSRVQAVYTPHEHRRRGYASACVAAVAASVLDAGRRCILYTDLGNPTSNRIYRAIGFQAVAEALRYRFV